jgi:hypothetical protein
MYFGGIVDRTPIALSSPLLLAGEFARVNLRRDAKSHGAAERSPEPIGGCGM